MTLSWLYYRTHSDGDLDPIADLWPNIATEILGVWLSVRIIDALLRRREKRSAIRSGLVGNLNHLMDIAQTIAPHFDDSQLKRLESELGWFEELEEFRLRRLSMSEREKVATATGLASKILKTASRIWKARDELDRVARIPEAWEYSRLAQLRDNFHDAVFPHRCAADKVEAAVAQIQLDVGTPEIPANLATAVDALLAPTLEALPDVESFHQLVQALDDAVHSARKDILEEELA